MRSKLKIKYLNLVISICLFSAFFYLTVHENVLLKQYKFKFNISDIKNLFELEKCEAVNRSYIPYNVKINGVNYPKHVPLYLNKSINFECLNRNDSIKRILFWNAYFGNASFAYGLGIREPFKKNNCPITSCEATNDKKRLNESDLVLVHMRDTFEEMPKYRPPWQRWVFVMYESPIHSVDLTQLNGFFNLTSTYAQESDFANMYETDSNMKWEFNSKFNQNTNFLANKTEFAAAVISNCGGTSNRLNYIRELQKYIPVKVFGKCGIDCTSVFKNKTKGDCKAIIGAEFMFYLAFENSICKDYISEKFFVILKYPIIPVVLGGGNYTQFIPKSGFIHVNDFKTHKDLADYLTYLSKNQTAYNSYFKWKKHVLFYDKTVHFSPICTMCIRLHLESLGFDNIKTNYNVVSNLNEYWNGEKTCSL